jgi:hypothetical protein
MPNATTPLIRTTFGIEGYIFDLPVAASTTIYEGTFVSQLTASGAAVPSSTALSGVCVGVAQHTCVNNPGSAGDRRIQVETKRMFAFTNGLTTDAFSEATLIGTVAYALDDNTVADNSNSGANKAVGFFFGMEDDGRVRVYVDPVAARIVDILKTLTDAPATADALRDNIVAAFG